MPDVYLTNKELRARERHEPDWHASIRRDKQEGIRFTRADDSVLRLAVGSELGLKGGVLSPVNEPPTGHDAERGIVQLRLERVVLRLQIEDRNARHGGVGGRRVGSRSPWVVPRVSLQTGPSGQPQYWRRCSR